MPQWWSPCIDSKCQNINMITNPNRAINFLKWNPPCLGQVKVYCHHLALE